MIKQGYNKGRGSFKIRGEINIESLKNGRERLVITSQYHIKLINQF